MKELAAIKEIKTQISNLNMYRIQSKESVKQARLEIDDLYRRQSEQEFMDKLSDKHKKQQLGDYYRS